MHEKATKQKITPTTHHTHSPPTQQPIAIPHIFMYTSIVSLILMFQNWQDLWYKVADLATTTKTIKYHTHSHKHSFCFQYLSFTHTKQSQHSQIHHTPLLHFSNSIYINSDTATFHFLIQFSLSGRQQWTFHSFHSFIEA